MNNTPLRIINFEEWKQQQPKRKMVSDSIKKLFDTTGLTRKGQKAYKQKKVKSFEKSLKLKHNNKVS